MRSRPPPRRVARLYIGGVWIRETNGLHMRRLIGCLLVMGVVGCGDDPSPPGDDPVSMLEKWGGWIRRDRQGEVVNVSFALHRRGMAEVTDEQLVHLKEMTHLRVLTLDNTRITDTGLVHLKGMTELQTLYLGGTRVSSAGLADLKKSLPICKSEREPHTLPGITISHTFRGSDIRRDEEITK